MKAIPLTGELVGLVIVKVSVDGDPGVTTVGLKLFVTMALGQASPAPPITPSVAFSAEMSTFVGLVMLPLLLVNVPHSLLVAVRWI